MALQTIGWILAGVVSVGVIIDLLLQRRRCLHGDYVRITQGPHQGREGKVVNTSWIGNLYHTWVSVNVSANEQEIRDEYGEAYGVRVEELIKGMKRDLGPRRWLRVKRSWLKMIDVDINRRLG